ncbi:MAG: hypothetical protein IJU26_00565 [Synergistaceae bacterium]|nr:hypothetical protein [Synergistaceae bacterium]
MKRRAVSIVELSIGIALLAFLAAQISLSMTLTTHTPKHEAERLAKKLSSLMLKADKTQTHFQIEIEPDKMYIQWNTSETSIVKQADRDKFTETFPASSGCSYEWNAPNKIVYYSHITNKFSQGATITITGNGDPYYIKIATIGSRVRLSDTP